MVHLSAPYRCLQMVLIKYAYSTVCRHPVEEPSIHFTAAKSVPKNSIGFQSGECTGKSIRWMFLSATTSFTSRPDVNGLVPCTNTLKTRTYACSMRTNTPGQWQDRGWTCGIVNLHITLCLPTSSLCHLRVGRVRGCWMGWIWLTHSIWGHAWSHWRLKRDLSENITCLHCSCIHPPWSLHHLVRALLLSLLI